MKRIGIGVGQALLGGFGLAVAMLAAAGCAADPSQGYSLSGIYPANVRTVFVPIFTVGEKVYQRDLDFRLTEAVQKRIEHETPFKIVTRGRADTELRGSIDRVSQRVLSSNPDSGLPNEMEVTFSVSFTWTDLRNGSILARATGFRQSDTYIPRQPLGEDFFQGSESLINKLAQRIVEQMEVDWSPSPTTAPAK